jgi:hypothetical protein
MYILRRIPWLFIAVIAYYLPWVFHKTAALTANAYDLAEWVSIHPEVRNGNPPLLAPFLLRVVLVGLAVLFALQAAKKSGWIHWLYVAMAWVLVITLLPPLEFFRGSFDDPNYRQQFALSLGALIGVVGIAVGFHRKMGWLHKFTVPFAVAIVIAAVVGEALAWNVVGSLGIHEALGGGVVVLVACLIMLSITSIDKKNWEAVNV